MKCYVVTEGQTDAVLLAAVLGPLGTSGDVQMIPAGGRPGAVSRARTLLATGRWPLALVVDAETTSEALVAEMRTTLTEALAQAGPRDGFGVFLAVPALEAFLFADDAGLRRYFGNELTTERLIRSRFEPRQVLAELFASRHETLTPAAVQALLDQLDLSRLRLAGDLPGLCRFVQNALRTTAA
jgi:hypothetical protein